MHEWALVDSVVTAARQVADSEKLVSVDNVVVVLGELQNIDENAVISIFDDLKVQHGALMKEARMVIEKESAAMTCNVCGKKFSLLDSRPLDEEKAEAVHFLPEAAKSYIRCPECASRDFTVNKGRGIYIKEICGDRK